VARLRVVPGERPEELRTRAARAEARALIAVPDPAPMSAQRSTMTSVPPKGQPGPASIPAPRFKVVLVASSGGHLIQLHRLKPFWERHDRLWVTFRKMDSLSLLRGEHVEWAHHPTTRNVPNAVRNLGLAWRLLRQARPNVVISSGAGVAFPFFVAARLLGIKTVYIEVYDRIDSSTLTGRLCYPISDLFLLQWETQRRFYPRGRFIGRLL
jgi:UDP-N-acetylglucosamine:LPS N-acetylglucosamine transferase